MARAIFAIDTYHYYHWSSRQSVKTNLVLKGEGKTCAVWFAEDPAASLPPASQSAPDHYTFYYHHHQLPQLIDMLRNEKPVYVFFNNDGGFANSRISTTDEPVVEGEQSL